MSLRQWRGCNPKRIPSQGEESQQLPRSGPVCYFDHGVRASLSYVVSGPAATLLRFFPVPPTSGPSEALLSRQKFLDPHRCSRASRKTQAGRVQEMRRGYVGHREKFGSSSVTPIKSIVAAMRSSLQTSSAVPADRNKDEPKHTGGSY